MKKGKNMRRTRQKYAHVVFTLVSIRWMYSRIIHHLKAFSMRWNKAESYQNKAMAQRFLPQK